MTTAYDYSDELYSDLHKDARGYRPGSSGYAYWGSLTPDEKQAHWDSLCKEMRDRQEAEQKREQEAVAAFELRITSVVEAGAKDRETAIKWMFDAEEDEYIRFDPDYFCYQYGLPYGYFKGVNFLNNMISHD